MPVEWEDAGDGWHVALRCGACEVTLDDDQAHAFDRALDRGAHRIARMVRTLERQRMLAAVESRSIALERDDDLAPGRPTR